MSTSRRHPVIALTLRLSAAMEDAQAAWCQLRRDIRHEEHLHHYRRRLRRCHALQSTLRTLTQPPEPALKTEH